MKNILGPYYEGPSGTFCQPGYELTDLELCKAVASLKGLKAVALFEEKSFPTENGVPYGCWRFTGKSTISFNTNTAGSPNGAWNSNVTPVCRRRGIKTPKVYHIL